jgi:hypothetical protein
LGLEIGREGAVGEVHVDVLVVGVEIGDGG